MSEEEKWVKMPSASSPGRAQEAAMAATPVSKCSPRTRKPSRLMPVSTLMWTFSAAPQRRASALYSSALAWAETVWVMP